MRKTSGFTLLEVLVATVVMAVAVTGTLSVLSSTMRNASRLTDHDRSSMLARRKMDELLTEKKLPRHTVIEGQFDMGLTNGLPSGWKARVTPFEIPPNPVAGTKILDRIEVQIWWTVAANTRTLSLEAFRRSTLTNEDIAAGVLLPR